MKNIYKIISILLLTVIGTLSTSAETPPYGPSGEDPNGVFYQYFTNIAKTTTISNPYISGFGVDYTTIYSDGNTLIKNFLATYGSSSNDIVTGFNSDGTIKKTNISVFMKNYLKAMGQNPLMNGIIGFNLDGTAKYSQEVGYWNNTLGTITYAGGVQIGNNVTPGSMVVVGGNVTISSTPSADDDLVTKGYVDAYMKKMCEDFLGEWDSSAALCIKKGTVSTNSCSPTLPTCNGVSCTLTYSPSSVNQSWVKGAGSCGYACTGGYTGPTCSIPPAGNSCSPTLPACNGVSCSTMIGTPSSVNQSWVKLVGACSCCFSCINGYSGDNCETSPTGYSWKVSEYGACSMSCGDGIKSRSVWCEKIDGTTVTDALCGGGKPSSSTSCNNGVCCVSDGSCSANPACETTGYGVDNCGNSCSRYGGSCGGGGVTCPGGSDSANSPDNSNHCSYSWSAGVWNSDTSYSTQSIGGTGEPPGSAAGSCNKYGSWNFTFICPNKTPGPVTCVGGGYTIESSDGSNTCQFYWPTINEGQSASIAGTGNPPGNAAGSCANVGGNGQWSYSYSCPNKATPSCAGGGGTFGACSFNWGGASAGACATAAGYPSGSISACCDSNGQWGNINVSCP